MLMLVLMLRVSMRSVMIGNLLRISTRRLRNRFRLTLVNIRRRQLLKNFPGIRSRRHGCIALPQTVLMRVRIVTDAADDEARKLVHEASRLHLEAENVPLCGQLVPNGGVSHELIGRGNDAMMDNGIRLCAPASLDEMVIAATVGLARPWPRMHNVALIKSIGALVWASEALHHLRVRQENTVDGLRETFLVPHHLFLDSRDDVEQVSR